MIGLDVERQKTEKNEVKNTKQPVINRNINWYKSSVAGVNLSPSLLRNIRPVKAGFG